ncbi:helix-turn-helix domain-containing protein [Campylobacter sputorum]|uniref:helix-turn-helix domain-containing protein n=1 Tax=Campylobacter sputorum TaxID=206 RepID=UPI0009E02DDD|nr:helix-turn-helix domain-containing protein [Campylobacter sputorum]
MKLYNVEEVAKILKISVITVRRYIKSGVLEAFKYPNGRVWLIDENALNKFIAISKR